MERERRVEAICELKESAMDEMIVKYCPACGSDKVTLTWGGVRCDSCRWVFVIAYSRKMKARPKKKAVKASRELTKALSLLLDKKPTRRAKTRQR